MHAWLSESKKGFNYGQLSMNLFGVGAFPIKFLACKGLEFFLFLSTATHYPLTLSYFKGDLQMHSLQLLSYLPGDKHFIHFSPFQNEFFSQYFVTYMHWCPPSLKTKNLLHYSHVPVIKLYFLSHETQDFKSLVGNGLSTGHCSIE
jgi:hypothetical protein